ncbi:MAG: bifunctional 5,10-methylene-tetrahydrofolate dehydrogenase/5,10-methylene-tetrahydrofolate cyclohydrolase, partial [Bacteroidetes bacterium]|nr:bifunctional 5,10-methylene-tetrahydrofolate dehydrogenase/5,10-methylene-tetrahydrofolate cyclohydrolase [Bacteroidota bacterium]
MAIILDGSLAAASIRTEIAEAVKSSVAKGNRPPGLVAILVGEDGASQTYVGAKKTACDEVGFAGDVRRFAADISEADLLAEIEKINCDETIDGLIVQLPLPKHISEEKVTQAILPGKDVDGFH